MWFAERADVAIVSADSRQLYRGFDIGTAKPSPTERARAPHYGLDVLEPTQRASAAWWAQSADAWIDEIEASGRVPLVTGGTGLYLRALFGPLFEEPPLDAERRTALDGVLSSYPTETLRAWVQELDPIRSRLGRTQLLRAIEIALLTGHRVSALHESHRRPARRTGRYLVIDPGPLLASAIEARTKAMMRAGWREEVRGLMQTVPGDAPAWNGTGYRTIRALEQGLLSEADAEQQIVTETRQYAKRQRTWFRHQLAGEHVTRLSTTQPDWAERAMAWWRE